MVMGRLGKLSACPKTVPAARKVSAKISALLLAFMSGVLVLVQLLAAACGKRSMVDPMIV
jgi:hypothetical protein